MVGRPEDWMEAHWTDWFHTSDPLMVVKLSKNNGRLTTQRQAPIMWAMLAEMEVNHPAWGELLSAHVDAWEWTQKGRSLQRIQGHLAEEIREIQRECSWHEATPFRMLSRALAGDFARFLDEVNDSHFKVHFCEVIRDALPPPQCPDPTPEIISFLKTGPCPARGPKNGQGGWNSELWADWLESASIPDANSLGQPSVWASFRNQALEHARSGTHGSACWIQELLKGLGHEKGSP